MRGMKGVGACPLYPGGLHTVSGICGSSPRLGTMMREAQGEALRRWQGRPKPFNQSKLREKEPAWHFQALVAPRGVS